MSRAAIRYPRLVNGLLLLCSLLIGLLLAETVVRLFGADYARVWEPDLELGWHHIPGERRLWTREGNGLIEINSLGFRDRERQLQKPLGTFRILVFGDSMTEAVQVNLEQTFTYLLEQELGKRGLSIEVLNFGVNGYSPIQELLLLKREGPRYRPDLVILATYLDNDVSGCHPDLNVSQGGVPYARLTGETLTFNFSQAEQSFEQYHLEPMYSLRKTSYLYRWLSDLRWQLKAKERSASATPANHIPKRYELYQSSPTLAIWEKSWRIYERVILEFVAEAQRQQTEFMLLSVPTPHVVNQAVWESIKGEFPAINEVEININGPEQRLQTIARDNAIVLMQPQKAFQENLPGAPLFFEHKGHMTPRGHQLMADLLKDFLFDSGMIPHN